MSELIRRSDAIAIVQNAKYKFPTWPHIAEAKEDMVQAIKSAPTIDAVPVVRGEWFDRGSLSCRCSECGCKSNKEYTCCPNCGAKMESEGST